MMHPRGSLAVTALGDSVYAIGGFNSKEALHVVEVMDVRNNKWRSLSSLSTERAYGEAAVIADQVCRKEKEKSTRVGVFGRPQMICTMCPSIESRLGAG